MRTIKHIEREIADLQERYKIKKEHKPAALRKAGKRVSWLRFCIHYLEFHPNEQFIRDELGRVENKILMVKRDFFDLYESEDKLPPKVKTKYLNERGMKTLRLQKQTLSYILDL